MLVESIGFNTVLTAHIQYIKKARKNNIVFGLVCYIAAF